MLSGLGLFLSFGELITEATVSGVPRRMFVSGTVEVAAWTEMLLVEFSRKGVCLKRIDENPTSMERIKKLWQRPQVELLIVAGESEMISSIIWGWKAKFASRGFQLYRRRSRQFERIPTWISYITQMNEVRSLVVVSVILFLGICSTFLNYVCHACTLYPIGFLSNSHS